MRGGLDDALERLARRDQLRMRTAGAAPAPQSPPAPPTPPPPPAPPAAHGLAEAIEAVRRVVERHPDLAITVYGQQGQASAEVRIERVDGVVQATVVSVEEVPPPALSSPPVAAPPPVVVPPPAVVVQPQSWPDPAGPAARLAEMIRQDPSLLTGPDDR